MSLTRVRCTLRGGGTLRGGTLMGGGVCWMLDTLRGYVGGGGRGKLGRGESGTSTREDRSKTAQILLENPFKNHRKKWAVFERFFSKIWAVWAVFPKKNRPNRSNRSNRSNLAGKPLKPLKSWAVFERDLDPGCLLPWLSCLIYDSTETVKRCPFLNFLIHVYFWPWYLITVRTQYFWFRGTPFN